MKRVWLVLAGAGGMLVASLTFYILWKLGY
jgi:hypothetical protein